MDASENTRAAHEEPICFSSPCARCDDRGTQEACLKVLVVTNRVPFVHGGAEELCDHLVQQLQRHGHEAEALRIPFCWDPAERLIEEMLVTRSLRIANVDRVIALKFPAYLVPHPNKVFWLLHQYRQAYDLFDAGQSNIPADDRGEQIRAAIHRADDLAFGGAQRIYANASVTARRLRRYNGFEATVLPPPVNDPGLFCGGASEGYVFAGGRVNAGKRQTLLVRALRHSPKTRLVIAGPPDTAQDAELLRRTVAEEGVLDRVTLHLRFLPRAELAGLINRCLAVAYLPFDEDSMGYVTMEAFTAAKPVITTSDSGGVLELVRHGQTGYVAKPSAAAIGAVLRRIGNGARAARMGVAGRERLAACGLDWPSTIERLLA